MVSLTADGRSPLERIVAGDRMAERRRCLGLVLRRIGVERTAATRDPHTIDVLEQLVDEMEHAE